MYHVSSSSISSAPTEQTKVTRIPDHHTILRIRNEDTLTSISPEQPWLQEVPILWHSTRADPPGFVHRDQPRSRIDVAVLDFAKAFDKVPHRRLMNKLRTYGIGRDVANWIRDFLNERTQLVVVDGYKSDSVAVMSGVPPGTVMGSLLFLLYINDLSSVVDPGTTVRLFANDCLIYRQIRSIEDHIQLQKDLDALSKWGDAWGMKFNQSKCNILTITNLETTTIWFYTLNSVILQQMTMPNTSESEFTSHSGFPSTSMQERRSVPSALDSSRGTYDSAPKNLDNWPTSA